MWERVQKPLLEVPVSATIPRVLKFYLIYYRQSSILGMFALYIHVAIESLQPKNATGLSISSTYKLFRIIGY